MQSPPLAPSEHVPFRTAFWLWLKIGLLSFGGPAGQIALMHKLVVDERKWVSENRFLHALNYCMLLPGPEAQQLAIYIGWLLHRTLGGLVAGILFVLPGALVILALSILYAGFQDVTLVEAIFYGIKAAVLAVVVQAVLKIAAKALKNGYMYGIAAGAFVAIFFFDIAFPIIIAAAALIGFLGKNWKPEKFLVIKDHDSADSDGIVDAAIRAGRMDHVRPSTSRAIKIIVICLLLWLGPLVVLAAVLGPAHVYVQEGLFFSKMAVVTFGGAYAVLAYVAQQAVGTYGWLAPGEMLDGLGMAETTPGPLIMVLQFVGFMAAYRNPGMLDPMVAGVFGALITTWVTFAPCFLWIFLGGPYIESLRGNKNLSAALSAITAAVVGVILNLALWFGLHVLFAEVGEWRGFGLRLLLPDPATLDVPSALLAVAAFLALWRLKANMILVLAVSAVAGTALFYVQ
ncbi:chromate efflux transporter [Telmatospirillum sp. J64-1]|uniref:chromate efflux transporter n=1 Tax=Telmatospirillum sp. J64-1 TaxID=2502183 RepID=UPI00115E6D06|nr:chromate efflux transporter [Telmatospirillum sp. J64-1]